MFILNGPVALALLLPLMFMKNLIKSAQFLRKRGVFLLHQGLAFSSHESLIVFKGVREFTASPKILYMME